MTPKKIFALKAYLVIDHDIKSKVFLGYVHEKTHFCLDVRREDSFSKNKIRFYKRKSDLTQSLNHLKEYNFNGRNFRVENTIYCYSQNQVIFEVEEFLIVSPNQEKHMKSLIDFLFKETMCKINDMKTALNYLEEQVKNICTK